MGQAGETAVQDRGKTGVKAYEARRSSATSSRWATGVGIGGRVIIGGKKVLAITEGFAGDKTVRKSCDGIWLYGRM